MRPERGAATPAKGRETRPHRVRSTSQERHRCSAAGREDRREESTATGTDDSSWGEGSAGERHRDDSEPCGLSGFRATHGRPPVGNAGPSQPSHDVNHRKARDETTACAWAGVVWPAVVAVVKTDSRSFGRSLRRSRSRVGQSPFTRGSSVRRPGMGRPSYEDTGHESNRTKTAPHSHERVRGRRSEGEAERAPRRQRSLFAGWARRPRWLLRRARWSTSPRGCREPGMAATPRERLGRRGHF